MLELSTGISGDREEECERGSRSPAVNMIEQVDDRSVCSGQESPSNGWQASVWIIQPRTDSMLEVVELLVNVMGKKCKKNKSGFLSQRSLITQG